MSNEKRPARLGRGLSSLMSAPISVPASAPPPGLAPRARLASSDDVAVALVSPPESPADASEVMTGVAVAVQAEAVIVQSEAADAISVAPRHAVLSLSLNAIAPNPNQPRKLFDAGSLEQLAASIRADGLIQPIVVRQKPGEAGRYELVAGERRLRAAQIAGLQAIPAIVRELTDRQSTEWALIENLQREDLNPIDRAEAFAQLVDRYQLSHDAIAQRVGQDRSSISNFLRLLSLPRDAQDLVRNGLLSFGKARALLGLPDLAAQRALAIRAVKENWSARQVEAAVRAAATEGGGGAGGGDDSAGDGGAAARAANPRLAHLADLQEQIGRQLGTKVKLTQAKKKGAGTLAIAFYSNEQFEELLGKLGVRLEE